MEHSLQMSDSKDRRYANRHIPKFLALPDSMRALTGDECENASAGGSLVQVVKDGRTLTARRLLKNKDDDLTLTRPIVVEDTPNSIGMKVLSFKKRHVTVRDIADIIGHDYPVHVIDVEHQEELDGWRLTDLVEYFEDEQRLMYQHESELDELLSSRTNSSSTNNPADATSQSTPPKRASRRPRRAAEKCRSRSTMNRPRVLNQISLEFSKTPLSTKILSPQFVRDIDWIDHAWPGRNPSDSKRRTNDPDEVYPSVQYYCLTSSAGAYTDFHIDFGGTAVWYHVLSGQKIFCLIPPTKENLGIYEDWLCSKDQAALFLPDMIPNPTNSIIRLSLRASQTLVIPTGWIHAVYTSHDSVVLGGNFLHGMDIALQVDIHCIETRTRVQEKFRFPFFLPLNFYAGGMYLRKLRSGNISQREVDGLKALIPVLEEWWKVHQTEQSQVKTGPSVIGAARYAAAHNDCKTVESFLEALKREHARVQNHGISPSSDYRPPQPSSAMAPGKLKLRLKLPGTSGSQQVNTHSASPDTPRSRTATPRGDGNGEFRIVLSSEAVKLSAPLPPPTVPEKKTRKPREETDWYVEAANDDEDWKPSKQSNPKRTVSSSLPSKRKSTNKPIETSTGNAARHDQRLNSSLGTQKAQKASTTSRQRLMKRFR